MTTKISRGPPVTYSNLRRPLGPPPRNMEWIQVEGTREWRLENRAEPEVVVDVVGTAIDPNEDNGTGPYVQHIVQPSDTLEGILLKYRITSTELRQANNGCSATNLNLMPNPLRIPVPCTLPEAGIVLVEHTKQEKLSKFRRAFPSLSLSEAKCYLELNNGSLEAAITNAKQDGFSS